MARTEKTVFISYRRTDVYTALAVYQDLTSKGYDVFFDYSSISSGDFEQIIISNIRGRAHFLLILTPTALDRVNEPGDWLRREIETAIDEQRNIIPLFFKGFNFGNPSVTEKLTGKLSALPRYNGMNVHEDYFPAAMVRLSEQFLKVPLTTILHPVSTEVRKAVKQEQNAVEEALAEKWEDLREFFNSPEEKTVEGEKDKTTQQSAPVFVSGNRLSSNSRLFGIGIGILFLLALSWAGIKTLSSRGNNIVPTMTIPIVTERAISQPPLTEPASSITPEMPTSTSTAEPTLSATPLPTLGVGSTEVANDGMVLLYVPAGPFKMGFQGGDNETDERPVHTVDLDAFWIDQTEVTNAMYAQCVAAGKCDPPGPLGRDYYGVAEFDNFPVTSVSWDNAMSYCLWAGRTLPTEAQWEKAARGLQQPVYPWGNKIDCLHANYFDDKEQRYCFNSKGGPSPVKNYELGKSSYGAYDMAGNVWEWVVDWYEATYYRNSPSSNPTGPDKGDLHVARGGAWDVAAVQVRSSNRAAFDSRSTIGFRCAMSTSP